MRAVAPTVLFVPGFMQRGEPLLGMRGLDFATWTFEERIGELLAAVESSSAVVGYSMGGRIALHAALRAPDRFEALVLIGVSAGVDDPEERRRSDESLAAWIEQHSIEEVVERWEAQPVFATQSEALREQQRPGRLSHEPRDLARLLRSAGQGATPAVWDRLRELRMPVLLIAGERDQKYVAAAHRMAGLLPRARLEVIPGAGHAPHLEQPELVAELLDEYFGDRGVVDREA
jgi:2-succinyl-6-hydroxy-2,4-cyclohexadiene-1-carboxylate synthase